MQRARRSPVSIRSPNPAARARLFCFPYAGGGAASYRDWPAALPADIEVAAVQPPGREWRIREPAETDMRRMAEDALEAVRPLLDKPFALLGASMGGTLIFELARQLRAAGLPLPLCLFPLACGAPHTPETELYHQMPDDELLREIESFGVMSEAVSGNPELIDIVLPILRADCIAHETYEYRDEPPFDFPIWPYGGIRDATMERERLDAWSVHTTAECRVQMIDGGHLFVDERPELLMQSIARHVHRAV